MVYALTLSTYRAGAEAYYYDYVVALDAGHGIKFWLSPDGELLDAFLGGDSRLEAAED